MLRVQFSLCGHLGGSVSWQARSQLGLPQSPRAEILATKVKFSHTTEKASENQEGRDVVRAQGKSPAV